MLGQPIGKEGGLLGQFLGTIARNGGYCPVGAKDWRKVKKDYGETIIQFVQVSCFFALSTYISLSLAIFVFVLVRK